MARKFTKDEMSSIELDVILFEQNHVCKASAHYLEVVLRLAKIGLSKVKKENAENARSG